MAILQRKVDTPIRVSRAEKLSLFALAARYKSVAGRSVRQLRTVIRIFQPETVFKWHRALVRRKWTYRQKNRGGRPRTEKELEQLIVRLARENSDWGHGKIQGECRKLDHSTHMPSRAVLGARQVVWELQEREPVIRFLIRDNDKKFTHSFDSIFHSEGIRVITTPYQAPNANAHAERWVRTVRQECLDKILIINQHHLHQTMCEYTQYYDQARPHQGINQRIPIPKPSPEVKGRVRCRDVLGGIIHDYYHQPA